MSPALAVPSARVRVRAGAPSAIATLFSVLSLWQPAFAEQRSAFNPYDYLEQPFADTATATARGVKGARAAAAALGARAGLEERIMAVQLNRRLVSPATRLWVTEEQVLVSRTSLPDWRLRSERFVAERVIDGRAYVDLRNVDGLEIWIDEASQEIWLEADPTLFEPTSIDLSSSRYRPPDRPALGAFAHYEVTGTNLAGAYELDGDLELGMFGPLGSGSTRLLARSGPKGLDVVRLASTWILDLPSRRESVRVGDIQSRPGSWWHTAQLGGVSWASDFTTQPGFIPYALPRITGEAALASELELYLGEVLRARERLPIGPFEVHNLPVVSGDGTFRVVIRDQLGRETVLTRHFYVSPSLLRDGLREFHFGVGSVRAGLGVDDDAYGGPALVGTERHGITDRLTVEWHGELLEDHQLLGAGGIAALGSLGIGHLTLAASRGSAGTARLWQYGLERQATPVSFGFLVQQADPGFLLLGATGSRPAPTHSVRARASIALGRLGSLSLAYADRRLAQQAAFESWSANLGTRLNSKLFLTISALTTLEPQAGHSVSLTVTKLLAPGKVAGARATSSSDGGDRVGLRFHKSKARGEGLGYSLTTEAGDSTRANGALELAGPTGSLILQGVHNDGSGGLRGTWRSSLVSLGGQLHASRLSDRSFGVVSTSGLGGVRVYHQNHLIGRSDRHGFLVVPGLLPYQPNRIHIPEADLPFGARVGALEKVVSPYARSGVLVDFPIETSRSALLTILQESGEPLPVGARVHNPRLGEDYPVARHGQVYVTDVGDRERFVASWNAETCSFELVWPEEVELEARPEPITCRREP